MKITVLLSNIYRLLLEGNRSRATDLLTEFMLKEQGVPTGLPLSKIGELSQGSPKEIVSRLRKLLTEQGLIHSYQMSPVTLSKDPDDLDDEDLELIDAVAAELEARAEVYVYDEEAAPNVKPLAPSDVTADTLLLKDDSMPPGISNTFFSEEDDEEYHTELSYHEYDDNWSFSEDDEDDDDLKGTGRDLEDIEHLDDLFLQGDEIRCVGALDDDFAEEYFGLDEEDELTDAVLGGRTDFEDIDISEGLSREERARQIAVRVAMIFGWERSGVDLLAEVFEEHGWGNARISIEQMLAEGVTEDELRLVKELKDLWEGNEVYALAFLRPGNRTGYCTYHGGRILSWRMAARVARVFTNGDVCEIESFLDKAFDAWYESSAIKYRYPVFLNYVKHVISVLDLEKCFPGGVFCDDPSAEDFEYEIEKDLPRTPLYRELTNYGLVPSIWNDFLVPIGRAGGKAT